jgi:ATP-binding cassette subfamily B multidrug efflux pump
MKELQYLNKYFAKYKFQFLLGILITIAAQIFSLFTPQLVKESIDATQEFLENGKEGDIYGILINNLLLIIATTLIGGILTFFMRQTLIVMSRHVEFDLKNEIFRHYERLTQSFYKRNRTGDLMNRISTDVDRVRQYVGPAIMYSLNTIVRTVVVVTHMCIISPKLTLYTLLPLPLLAWSIFKISKEINKRSTLYQQNLSKLSTFTQEMFSGIRIIKAYALEKQKEKDFTELSRDSVKKNMSLAKVNAQFGPLMILLIGISNLIVIYVGGIMYMNGSIDKIGTIAQFILYINMLTWPVASLGWISSMVQEAEASQKRINEFLKTEPEIQNTAEGHTAVLRQVAFENVSFTYEDTNITALKDVSFTVNKGETLAILGRTGSGKSTILSLISRLYDAESGQVKVDGQDIRKLNLDDLRDSIGFVPQDAFLFSDTIKNNIKFGNEDATDEEVIAVAKKAVVHNNIVGFTKEYETILGERGITLSGGQKQRVSIARALIKDAPILLLDDCLSAVDTETEEAILNNLLDFCRDKTTVIVSHRVSSAKNADRIIIMEDGKIIQEGTHNQLVNEAGYYKDLYLKQLSEKDLQ